MKCLCFRGKKKNSDCMNLDERYCVNGRLIFEQVRRITTSTIHVSVICCMNQSVRVRSERNALCFLHCREYSRIMFCTKEIWCFV